MSDKDKKRTETWMRMGKEMTVSKDILVWQKLGVDEKRKGRAENTLKLDK